MRGRHQASAVLLALGLLSPPAPAAAQFGAVEAFLRNVTDVSFYGGMTRLAPASNRITERGGRLASYGVEMLFEIGSINRPVGEVSPQLETVRLELIRVEVSGSGAQTDTLHVYEPRRVPAPARPTRRVWTFEMGFGYGQIVGFDIVDDGLDMRGSVRDLPSVSVYATHEATGIYAGMRSGFMKTQGLQVVDTSEGTSADGTGESFLAGAVAGYALDFGGAAIFMEAAYTMRYLPSIQWTGDQAVRTRVPRDLRLSGWGLSTGIQIPLRER